VVAALALSALVGSAIGWFLLSRHDSPGKAPSTATDLVGQPQTASLPPAEVDERQQLLSRLRALQVDRTWFLKLVNTAVLDRFPERGGRLPSDDLEDAPLRRVWNDLAEDWLARIEQLPPTLRSRLGSLKQADWSEQRAALVKQGVTPRAVEQLVSAGARDLLPGDARGRQPREPYRQLWYAAAIESLRDVQIEQVKARPRIATNLSLRIPAGGARLISVVVPAGAGLVLGINGTPLMEMTVFGADGEVRAERGPLRVSTLPPDLGSPVQVLITNDGVSSGSMTLSCRADQPRSRQQKPVLERRRRVPLPEVEAEPIPDPATGE
jgi:serine/threonine-protein kinase